VGYSRGKNKAGLPGFQDLVEQDLKTGNFRAVYLLAGEDTLRIEGVVEKIRKDALGEQGSAFSFHVFQGDQTSVEKILQQALSLPMLGNLQVVWVKHADRCLGSQDTQGRQRLVEAINLVRGDFAKILVITHIDEIKDQFPNRIEIEKTDRGSTVSVV